MAAAIWAFTLVWLGMLCAMSYVFYRDGVPEGYSHAVTTGVLAIFWIAGFGLAAFAASKPCFLVTINDRQAVTAVWRYPHRRVHKDFHRQQLRPAQVIDSRDSDDDPYYFARVHTSDGKSIDLAEGHSRITCETACARFNEVVFREGVVQTPPSK